MKIRILGSSRSGSTVLENYISSTSKIIALGEVKNFFSRGMVNDELCSCGATASKCCFWSRIIASSPKSFRELYQTLPGSFIDSSKSPFFFLRNTQMFDLTIILVRSPSAVVSSYRERKERTERVVRGRKYMRRLPPLVALAYWLIIYLLTPLVLIRSKSKGVLIFYEDFANVNGGYSLNLNFSHQVSGNPSRLSESRVRDPKFVYSGADRLLMSMIERYLLLFGVKKVEGGKDLLDLYEAG